MITVETYQAFRRIWMFTAAKYNIHPDRVDHLFLPAYECAIRNHNESRGRFEIYAKFIARAHLTRFISQSVARANKRHIIKEELYGEHLGDSPERMAESDDFTRKLLDSAGLTAIQRKAVEQLVLGDMTLQEFTSTYNPSACRQAGGNVKQLAVEKLRKAYARLEGCGA